MTWQCKLIEFDISMDPDDLQVGDMFYAPPIEDKMEAMMRLELQHLSDFYYLNNLGRRPLFVILPGPCCFCVDTQTRNAGTFSGGWTVTGDAPNITVAPSINIGGLYHGFLQNGMISDDCENRIYNSEGYEVRK